MPTATIAGKTVEVNDEGFMTKYDEWNEEIAKELAKQIEINMTEDHWKIIRFLRDDFKTQGETATSRRVPNPRGDRPGRGDRQKSGGVRVQGHDAREKSGSVRPQ